RFNCSFAIDNALFLYAAHIDALCKILLYEGVYAEDGDDGAYDHRIDDGHYRKGVYIKVAGYLVEPLVAFARCADESRVQVDEVSDIDLHGPREGLLSHHAHCPEVAVPAGDAEEERDCCNCCLAHGDIYLEEHLHFGGAV